MVRKKESPSLDDIERAERLRKIIEALYEVNKNVPIIVEGNRDVSALRKLGLIGEIIPLHNGESLYDFCLDIAERFQKVILLLDWDKKGENLNRAISTYLSGYWEEFSFFREILKVNCQKEIKDIEGIPKLLRRLEGHEEPWY
ncbi:MAG: toprim domain-containing protein [Thermodesulfovibrionales bacterium]